MSIHCPSAPLASRNIKIFCGNQWMNVILDVAYPHPLFVAQLLLALW